MQRSKRTSLIFATVLALAPLACTSGDDDDAAGDTGGTGMADDDGTTSATTSSVTTAPTTGVTSLPPPDTGEDDTTGTPAEYDFDDTPPERMTQIDRMGMPAVNTAVISSKNDYNGSTPADDIAGDFVDEIVANLTGLHEALDDDLTDLGLVPCAVEDCVAQAAPLVVPDVLHIDPTAAAGFPNGRLLTDPVVDVTLAVVMLDLTVAGQTALTFAQVPVNPTANDVEFLDDFPYLAQPH